MDTFAETEEIFNQRSTEKMPEGKDVLIDNLVSLRPDGSCNNSVNNVTSPYKRLLSRDQEKSDGKAVLFSSSTTSLSPPPYQDVRVQPPPTYKDLFPTFFKTYSREDHVTVRLRAQTSRVGSENEASVDEERSSCFRILAVVLFGCFVIVFLIIYKYGLV